MSRGHAEALFPMIEDALAEGQVSYGDLARVAVCTGPGSFTGIRAGVAAARGLSVGLGIPAIGISRLEALGYDWTGFVAIRGRGDQFYVQRFASGQSENEPFTTSDLPEGDVIGDALPGHIDDDGLPEMLVLARLAASREPSSALAAPLYLRGPDADPPRDGPPPMLD